MSGLQPLKKVADRGMSRGRVPSLDLHREGDRKRGVEGKSGDLGGRRIIKKKKKITSERVPIEKDVHTQALGDRGLICRVAGETIYFAVDAVELQMVVSLGV